MVAIPVPYIVPGTREQTVGYVGYSWTTMLFGPAPAFMRRDMAGVGIGFIALAVNLFLLGGLPIATGIWAVFYNRFHRQQLERLGGVPVGEEHHVHSRLRDAVDTIEFADSLSKDQYRAWVRNNGSTMTDAELDSIWARVEQERRRD